MATRDEDGDRPPDRPVQLVDQTEDGFGAGDTSEIDAGETGDDVLGELGDPELDGDDARPGLGPPQRSTAADRVPMAAEEAAVHIVDPDDEDDDLG